METPYYVHKLKENLSQRQRRSPSYSLRAFARDLDLHPATISMVFQGKRSLPVKDSFSVADKLNLNPKERTLFLESLLKTKTTLDDIKVDARDERYMLDESYFNVLAEWEHYGLLTLMECDDFITDSSWISERLGITLHRTEVVIENLLTCGLIRRDGEKLICAHVKVRTTEDVTSPALRKGHLETLDMGKEKLENIPVELRDFSATMYALDPEKVPEAKTIIREFRQKMRALLKDGHKSEVYQLAIQFYPLTKSEKDFQ